ncbi:hypothetical protein BMS3Abin01_00548 [bacterium BMS3Abin01]|nr:hypothetical protein BMS3Abin01_00548 [bacterium BMS3Abin01]
MKTNVRLAAGIIIIILGLLIAITPRYILPVCDYQSKEDASMGQSILLAQATGMDGDMTTMTGTTGTTTGMDGGMGTSTGMDDMNSDMAGADSKMDEGMEGMDMSGGNSPCYFTSRGAITLGLIIMLIGLAVMIASTPEAVRLLALVLGGAGLLVILTPLYLLPVCENPQMACNKGAEQLLIVLGVATMLAAAVIALMAGKNKDTGGAA